MAVRLGRGARAAGLVRRALRPLAAARPADVRERLLVRVPFALEVLAGTLGVAAFAFVVYAGLAGNQTATANLAPTAIFVLFWVGVPCASVLLGDVFAAFNPWRAVGRACGWLARRVAGADLPEPLAYPERVGRWPAAVGVLALRVGGTRRRQPHRAPAPGDPHARLRRRDARRDEPLRRARVDARTPTRSASRSGCSRSSPRCAGPTARLRLRPPLAGAVRMPQVAGAVAVVVHADRDDDVRRLLPGRGLDRDRRAAAAPHRHVRRPRARPRGGDPGRRDGRAARRRAARRRALPARRRGHAHRGPQPVDRRARARLRPHADPDRRSRTSSRTTSRCSPSRGRRSATWSPTRWAAAPTSSAPPAGRSTTASSARTPSGTSRSRRSSSGTSAA